MGKISNMQQKQNKENGVNLSYARNHSKPRFKIKGMKDVGLLYKPGIEKEYSLTKNQKKLIRGLRFGTLSLATLASIATITVGTSHLVNRPTSVPTQKEQEIDELAKDDVLDSAENTLLDFIYKDYPSALRTLSFIKCHHDPKTNIDTLTVYDRTQNPNSNPTVRFSYTRYNDTIDKLISKSSKNNPEINELLDSMLDISLSENPSQEDLEGLSDKCSNFDFSQLTFDGKNIVDKSSEKDFDNER